MPDGTPHAPDDLDLSVPDPERRPNLLPQPESAVVLLAQALGLSLEDARLGLTALVRGGYVIAPREPSNAMLVAYAEALIGVPQHPGSMWCRHSPRRACAGSAWPPQAPGKPCPSGG